MQVRLYVTLTFSSSYFDLRNMIPYTDKTHWPDYKEVSVCHTGVVLAYHFNTPFLVTYSSWPIEYSSANQRQWSRIADYITYNNDLWGHGIFISLNYGG